MTHSRGPEPLRPMLKTVESHLVERLEEACAHGVTEESTAELVRLEETLTEAASAAKQAVSLRRRLRTGHGAHGTERLEDATEGAEGQAASGVVTDRGARKPDAGDEPADGTDRGAVREFLDQRGVTWRAWAVTEEQMDPERLIAGQMGEYRNGWLAFECADNGERRRLPHYPPNWRRLSNLALEGLLGRAEAVRRRHGQNEESEATPD